MGEGAGVLVLEEAEHAARRGARVYAEFLGGATNCDAHHVTEPRPDGAGVQACLELALQRAGVEPADVGYVNAHGTSTLAGDMAEYRAITRALPGGRCAAAIIGSAICYGGRSRVNASSRLHGAPVAGQGVTGQGERARVEDRNERPAHVAVAAVLRPQRRAADGSLRPCAHAASRLAAGCGSTARSR